MMSNLISASVDDTVISIAQSVGSAVESPLLSSLDDGGLSTRDVSTILGTLGNTRISILLPLLLLSSIDVCSKSESVQ